jgi:Helicase associated domain.
MVEINPLTSSSPLSNCSLEAVLADGYHENERNDLLVMTSTTGTSLPQDTTSGIAANATFPSSIRVETNHPASSSSLLFHLSKPSSLNGQEQKEATASHANSTNTARSVSPRNKSSHAAPHPPSEQKHNEQQKEEDQQKPSHPLYFEGKTSFVRRPVGNSPSPCNDRTATTTTATTAIVPPTAITVTESKSDTCSSNTGLVGVGQQSVSHHKPRVNSSYSISPLPTVTFNNHSTAIQNNYNLALSSPQKNPSLSSIADPMVLNNPVMNNNFQTIDFHFLNDNSGFTFPDYSMTMQQPIVNMMTSVEKRPVVPSNQQKIMSSATAPSLFLGGGERVDSAVASEIPVPYQYPHLTSNAPTPSPFLDPKVPSSHNIHCTNSNTVLMSDDSGSGGGRKPRKDFQYRLEEIRKFQQKHGHSMIPHKYPMNPSLGTWVDTQRRRYRKLVQCKKKFYSENPQGTGCELEGYIQSTGPHISQDHIDRLLEVGFVFEPRLSRRDTWERRVEELKRFKELQGHCNVKEDDRDFPGLGKWVSYVRRIYRLAKNKKMNSSRGKRLSDDRIDELRQMGFIFEFKEEMAMKRFKDGLQSLKEFKLKEGHCKVPSFYADNPTFGLCVEDMRTEYKMICNQIANGGDGFTAVMSHEIVEELAKMGFLSEEGVTPYPTNGAGVTFPATVSE